MSYTLVAFHAHPDDESVLTAGTMARAAAAGHRVVLVLATDGGLSTSDGRHYVDDVCLGTRRLAEARVSANVLGVTRFAYLGYADSGPKGARIATSRMSFVEAPVHESAQRLAAILVQESADVLLSYDRNGGYGHPDHLQVHRVAAEAARLARTPRVLQATVPRETLSLVARLRRHRTGNDHLYSARSEITHQVSVRRHIARKRASLRAHASQTAANGGSDRMLAAAVRIPRPLFDLAFGREWFVDPDHHGPRTDDIFAGL